MVHYLLNIFWFLNTEPIRFYHKEIWVCFFYSNSAIQSLLFLWLAIFCRCFCIHIITVFIDIVQNSLLLLFVHVKKLTLNKYISGKIWQKKLILINWRKNSSFISNQGEIICTRQQWFIIVILNFHRYKKFCSFQV